MSELKDKNEQYKKYLKLDEDKLQQDKMLKGFSRFVLVAFWIIVCFVVFSFINDNYESFKMFVQSFSAKVSDSKEGSLSFSRDTVSQVQKKRTRRMIFPSLKRYQNILLLGVDSNGEGTDPFVQVRSDTIILMNIDTHGKVVNAISIPRDSKVYVSDNHGIQKINAAYALGGIDLTKKTIEETLGVKINNYIIVNAEGVRNLIDALGGVSIYVDKPMQYNDYTGKLFINLKKGAHVLDGKDAEAYLRFRKDLLGDIGRTHRQQTFLKALLERLKSPDSIKTIPIALKIANQYIKTDLNLYQLSQFAALAREIDSENITITTLPGAPNKKGHISYWILDPDKTQKIIDKMIYHKRIEDEPERPLTAGIMYSFDKEADALRIKEKLKSSGYKVNCIGRAKFDKSHIVAHQSSISKDYVKSVMKKFPETKEIPFSHENSKTYCVNSDFTIFISDDYMYEE